MRAAKVKALLVGLLGTLILQSLAASDPGQSPERVDYTAGVAPDTTSQERVGKYCDLRRIRFEGTWTFSDDVLRRGLRHSLGFTLISHPFAPMAEYLGAIETRIRNGYQQAGFPDVEVTVEKDEVAEQIIVKVREGRRYLCGPVTVTGLKRVDPGLITKRLSVSPGLSEAERSVITFKNKNSSAENGAAAQNTDDAWEPYLWTPGEPAHLAKASLEAMSMLVSNTFWGLGFASPRFTVRALTNPESQRADLRVEVQTEGPPTVIGQIEISGAHKNSRESLLKYLKLKPGLALNSNLISQTESRLWNAARFLHYEVGAGAPDDQGRAVLKISLMEYKDAPPLDREFSTVEKALLRAQQWWASPQGLGQDFVMKSSSPTNAGGLSLELDFSPRKGAAFTARATTNSGHADRFGLVLTTNLIGLYPAEGRPDLVISDFKGQIRMLVGLEGTTNPSQPFTLSLAAGFQASTNTDAPACHLEATLAPVAFIRLAHEPGGKNHFEHGKWLAGSGENMMEVDDRTGRFRGHLSGFTWLYDFETNAFDQTGAALELHMANRVNRYDKDQPTSSLVSFALEEMLRSRFLENKLLTHFTGESRLQLAKVAGALCSHLILAPLDKLIREQTDSTNEQENFFIPVEQDVPSARVSGYLAQITDWVVGYCDDLFPVGSWPWTLVRETALGFVGKGRYGREAFNEIYQSYRTGPLGCLATAQMLRGFHLPGAKDFAARGLERLSTVYFRNDARTLLDENSISGQCLLNLAEALRDLDKSNLEFLAARQSPARAQLIHQSAALMHEHPGRPTSKTLAPALEAFWESELKDQVAASLKKIVQEK